MMKVIQQKAFGTPEEAYEFMEVPIPTCNSNQIVVKIHAIGINPVDTYVRQGALSYKDIALPIIPGKDFAGTVDQAGENVKDQYPVGTKVWCTLSGSFGAYAQYATVTPGHDFIGKMYEKISFEQGAAIGIPYMTACNAIDFANAKSGETVVVHGASGGVGMALCNIASFKGCNVIATVSTQAGEQNAMKAGANAVFYHNKEGYVAEMIQYAKEHFGQIDTVIENAAHININSDLEMVKPGGTVIIVGSRGFQNTNTRMILAKYITIKGVFLFQSGKPYFEQYQSTIDEMLKSDFVSPTCKTFPFQEYAAAQKEVITPASGGAQGKVVLTFQ